MPRARRRIALEVLLAIVGGAGVWLVASRAQAPAKVGMAPTSARAPDERAALLENSLRALADAERDMPRDRWDPAWVVRQVGRHPDSLRRWVAERTAWVPYRGALRGGVGVLMDRRGNSLDRSLLLSELLARAGHGARLARMELTASQAEALLPPVLTAAVHAAEEPAPGAGPPDLRAVAAGYEMDADAVTRALEPQVDATARLMARLEQRMAEQAALLLAAVPGPDPAAEWSTRRDTALAALREHWWVQVGDGDGWRDLDLLGEEAAPGLERAPLETGDPGAVAAAHAHEVLLRVVVERRADGALRESGVLEHALRPAEVAGGSVVLQFWPTAWPATGLSSADGGASLRRAALQQEQWRASLVVNEREAASAVIDVVAAGGTGGSAAAEGNPFGGLGGAVAGAMRPAPRPAGSDDLTAVWLEYEVRVPGRAPRVVRRQIVDLVGPAARQSGTASTGEPNDSLRLARNLALMMRTEILVLGAHLAPETVIHRFAQDVVENGGLLRAVADPGFGADPARTDSLLRASRSGVSPLHTLAVLRQEALGDLAFLDRPVVLTRHQYPTLRAGGATTADAFDIVANEMGVALAEGDGFAARLAQGVWDTNLEAILGGIEGNAAEAFARDAEWSVLESDAEVGTARMTADARARVASELHRGALVVAPDAAAQGAWWRIDPATGDALGVGPLGWGQGVEYGTHLAVIVDMAKMLVFAYAQCQVIPQAANALNILGNEFWELGLTPSWVTQPPNSNLPEFSLSDPKAYYKDAKAFARGQGKGSGQRSTGKDFEDVAAENHRKCVLDAIRSGFLATAPILLMHLRADRAGLRYTRMAARARGPLSAGRRPSTGWRGRPPTGRPAPRPGRGPRAGQPAAAPAPPPSPPRNRYDPRPADGRVPPGRGPFQGDPANRQWHRDNWHPDPAQAHPATRAMGSPEIYDNADRAAVARYNAARQAGMDDQGARAESFKEWWQSAQDQRRARGIYQFPGVFPAEPGGGSWPEYVPDHPIGSPSPPLGSPPPGSPPPGSPPPGASPMGTSVGSPMATSVGPDAAPSPASSLTDARMAAGLAGLTGTD
jgi:hypothetical protein